MQLGLEKRSRQSPGLIVALCPGSSVVKFTPDPRWNLHAEPLCRCWCVGPVGLLAHYGWCFCSRSRRSSVFRTPVDGNPCCMQRERRFARERTPSTVWSMNGGALRRVDLPCARGGITMMSCAFARSEIQLFRTPREARYRFPGKGRKQVYWKIIALEWRKADNLCLLEQRNE